MCSMIREHTRYEVGRYAEQPAGHKTTGSQIRLTTPLAGGNRGMIVEWSMCGARDAHFTDNTGSTNLLAATTLIHWLRVASLLSLHSHSLPAPTIAHKNPTNWVRTQHHGVGGARQTRTHDTFTLSSLSQFALNRPLITHPAIHFFQ